MDNEIKHYPPAKSDSVIRQYFGECHHFLENNLVFRQHEKSIFINNENILFLPDFLSTNLLALV